MKLSTSHVKKKTTTLLVVFR